MLPQRLPLNQMQVKWASELDPIISNPILNNNQLQSLSLVSGVNVIDHKLGRKLIGWYTTRVRASVTIYDQQDTNQTPQLTLVLVSSAPAVIDLEVF